MRASEATERGLDTGAVFAILYFFKSMLQSRSDNVALKIIVRNVFLTSAMPARIGGKKHTFYSATHTSHREDGSAYLIIHQI